MIREIRALKKNSKEFDCEITISEVAVPTGNPLLFTVVIRDLTERKRAEKAEATARSTAKKIDQLKKEIESLEKISHSSQTSVTAKLLGAGSIREGFSHRFDDVVMQYGDLMEKALEQRSFKIEHEVPEKLQVLAEQIGFLHAGPRDVIDIYTEALRNKTDKTTPKETEAFVEEGRFLVLELMGYLVSFYRTHSFGFKEEEGKNGKNQA